MVEAIKWRSTIILAKLETSYGTDPTPTGADNAMLMTDVQLQPMQGDDVSRNLERPYLGAQEMIPTGLRGVLTGRTELVPSGTAGTAPAWKPLIRSCGIAETIVSETSVTYAPVSDSHESATIYLWKGSTQHIFKGARGNGVLNVNAQGVPGIDWTLTGLWSTPSEVTRATPDFDAWQGPLVATDTNTPTFSVNSVDLVLRNFSLDFGNDVQPRLLIGREEIKIVDKVEAITALVEAVPLTTLDPFSLAKARTHVAVSLVHGTAAGLITTISAPTCQVQRLAGYENQQDVLEWPLRLTPLPDDGNDQFSIALT